MVQITKHGLQCDGLKGAPSMEIYTERISARKFCSPLRSEWKGCTDPMSGHLHLIEALLRERKTARALHMQSTCGVKASQEKLTESSIQAESAIHAHIFRLLACILCLYMKICKLRVPRSHAGAVWFLVA